MVSRAPQLPKDLQMDEHTQELHQTFMQKGEVHFVHAETIKDRLLADLHTREVTLERDAVWNSALFIKTAREMVGKSQQQLGDAIGVSQARIAYLEGGSATRGPSVSLLSRIAYACGKKLTLKLE